MEQVNLSLTEVQKYLQNHKVTIYFVWLEKKSRSNLMAYKILFKVSK